MEFINLSLEKQGPNKEICENYEEIINNSKGLTVILGTPGSGKSTLLKHISDIDQETRQSEKIALFLKDCFKIKEGVKLLLLDGIDEFRSISQDKQNVLYDISYKISKIKEENNDLKLILSCREMDWYGEDDANALKYSLSNIAISIYKILPFNHNKQVDFIKNNSLAEMIDELKSKVSHYTFFSNPQMLTMLINLPFDTIKNIKSKIDLFNTYLMFCLEHNKIHNENSFSKISLDELIEYSGYLSCFYLFTGIDDLAQLVLDKICDNKDYFTIDKMKTVLKTKLFSENRFTHRTIAEFLFARFVISFFKKKDSLYKDLIKIPLIDSYFKQNERIPTQLRGAFSWLCSLSQNKDLISIDPYYQIINGDNSHFNPELKIELIHHIEKYLNNLEYKGDHLRENTLSGFYSADLDNFFLDNNRLFDTLNSKSTYSYKTFLGKILIDSKDNISPNLISKIRDYLNDNSIDVNSKVFLADIFIDSKEIIRDLLNEMRVKKITNNYLYDKYLTYLYPEYISITDTVDYLTRYTTKKREISTYEARFIEKTPPKNKRELITLLFDKLWDKKHKTWPNCFYHFSKFVSNYFVEELMKYPGIVDAKYIYDLFTFFIDKYPHDVSRIKFPESQEYHAWFGSYHEELSDQFSKLFFNDPTRKGEIETIMNYFIDYRYFICKNRPDKLLNFISKDNSHAFNSKLFGWILNYTRNNQLGEENQKLIEIANTFNLNDVLNSFLNPKKKDWEIELERYKQIQEEKENRITNENTAYFINKDDSKIMTNFDNMYFISNLSDLDFAKESLPIERGLYESKLLPLLQRFVFCNTNYRNLTNLSSLLDIDIRSCRAIDRVYLSSLYLNKWDNFTTNRNEVTKLLGDSELIEYLYIISVNFRHFFYNREILFSEFLESHSLADCQKAMFSYITGLFKKLSPDLESLISKFTNENNFETWKKVFYVSQPEGASLKDKLTYFILESFNFNLNDNDLAILSLSNNHSVIQEIITSIEIIKKGKRDSFKLENALSIYNILKYPNFIDNITKLESSFKTQLTSFLMDCYSTYESIEFQSGTHGINYGLGQTLRSNLLSKLSLEELVDLKKQMQNSNMWTEKINSRIEIMEQDESDSHFESVNISRLKELILDDVIISQTMFLDKVYNILEDLAVDINANRNNELELFYNKISEKYSTKSENECRDIILTKLIDRHDHLFHFTKEKHESNNRVDINVKYKLPPEYEVQIECKLNKSGSLSTKIKTQLIDQYLVKSDISGIFLVFEFKEIAFEKKLKILASIPKDYSQRVKIIYFDLAKK